jgi:OmpA-OmpF porin, OOP family
MRKYQRIFIYLFVCFWERTDAQNLVPNHSFEIFTECPDTATSSAYVILDSTWFQFNSADYFNVCDLSNAHGIPSNNFGFQFPHSGDAYVGLIAYYTPSYAGGEYIEVELENSLISGQTYYVQFYANLANISRYAIENLGALFTDTLFDPYPAPSYAWVTGIPQVENNPGNMLIDSIDWMVINGSFIANGGERFLTIGNFRNEANTVKQYLGGSGPTNLEAYYYIDDVYVGTDQPTEIKDNKKTNADIKVYPNPNTGIMYLDCNLKEQENGKFILYTITGEVIKEYSIAPGTKRININGEFLESGIYLYVTRINGKDGSKNKLIIIK